MKGMIVAMAVLLLAACSKSPSPTPPQTDTMHTGSHDTIPKPSDSNTHDTTKTPPPPFETPGKSIVVSMYRMTLFLDNSKEYDGWGIGYYLRVVDRDTSHYSAEIINAYKGICTIEFEDYADSNTVYHFSNYYKSKSGENATAADSAGLLQFHVFRKDGKNIKTGVKDAYMILQTYPGNINRQGTILIEGYSGDRRKLNVDSLVQIVSRRATLTLLNSDGF